MSWKQTRLEDHFAVGSSKRVLKSQWQPSGVPFYRGREVTKLAIHGQVANELFISEELYCDLKKRYGVPKQGDIVVTAIGTIGNSYIVESKDRFYFKDASVLWLEKKTDIDSSFVNYWLQSPAFKAQLDQGNGATVDTLTISKLKCVQLSVPTVFEQKHIVAILDEAFAGIDTAISNTKQNLANAQDLLDSYLNAALCQQGEGWVKRQFNEVCDITSSLVDPRRPEYADMLHVGAGNIVSKTGEIIGLQSAADEGLKSGKFTFDASMVLYSKIRPYLMKVVRPEFSGLCSADIYPLAPRAGVLERDFLFYLLLSEHFTNYAIAGSARAGMPKVNREHLFAYVANIPSVTVQKRLVEKLDSVFTTSQELESIYQQKLTALAELKQSLLQKAFSGELPAGKITAEQHLKEEACA